MGLANLGLSVEVLPIGGVVLRELRCGCGQLGGEAPEAVGREGVREVDANGRAERAVRLALPLARGERLDVAAVHLPAVGRAGDGVAVDRVDGRAPAVPLADLRAEDDVL